MDHKIKMLEMQIEFLKKTVEKLSEEVVTLHKYNLINVKLMKAITEIVKGSPDVRNKDNTAVN